MSSHRSPVVLVVDHQPDLRALLQTILRHHGLRVILAQNRTDAVLLFRANAGEIDVVLLNAAMPDWPADIAMNDLHMVRAEVPVCLLAGETRNGRPEPAGAHIIRKPFEPSELAKSVLSLVRPRDRRSEPRMPPQATRVSVGPGLMPEHVVESWIGDHSSGGLCLRLPEKLGEVGSILSIRAAEDGDEVPWVPVQVRHVRSEAGQWYAGCQFLHPAAKQFS